MHAPFLQSLVAEDILGFRRLFLLATCLCFMASVHVCLAGSVVAFCAIGSFLFKCLRASHSCSAVARMYFLSGLESEACSGPRIKQWSSPKRWHRRQMTVLPWLPLFRLPLAHCDGRFFPQDKGSLGLLEPVCWFSKLLALHCSP